MATMAGVIFGIVFLLAPQRGLIALARQRMRQRWEFAQTALAIHLLHHEGSPEAKEENRVDHLHEHFRWQPDFAGRVVHLAEHRGFIQRQNGYLELTDDGRQLASQALVHY